ncbi:disulfide bond formation protein B, partial [Bacillus subtilis]|nr:disulfide bond formation protein B [Bacillus subtilis]
CVSGVPCSGQYINWFGFITIPFLALIAFILIIIFMCLLNGEKSE